jgi:DNA-binding NtrC family response regulator
VILIVDDEQDVLTALRRILKPTGLPVTLASSPLEALELLAREPAAFRVILSDIDMPEMSGTQLLRTVRQRYPEVVRLLMTGRGTFDSALAAINEGEVHRYLTKPFEADAIRREVQDAVARHAELTRTTEASLSADRRRLLFEQLEQECPGITNLARDAAGVYLIDPRRCDAGEQLMASLGIFVAR